MNSIEDFISKWNNQFRYDFWWRQKYNVRFGSREHREANQIDIATEYFESNLYTNAVKKYRVTQRKEDEFKKTGIWITPKDISDEDWDKLSLDKLKGL
jgi:hypothetical protein